MAEVKAHEVDNYLKKPNEAHQIILIYGPDRGLVYERAQKFASQCGVDIEDPFATIKLESETLTQDPARLNDEANTVSMFGGKRLIWVKRGSEKSIVNIIESLLSDPPPDTFILIEGGELRKGTGLRKRIEQAKTSIALPCYQDSHRSLDSVIDEEIKKHNLQIDNEARALLKSLIGEDRMASKSEINKLCLYALSDGSITSDHIISIVGDASSFGIDTVLDSVATGNQVEMDRSVRRLLARGTSPVQIALATQRHFQSLHRTCIYMQAERCGADKAIFGLRPPLHFQRKPFFIKALSIWSLPTLAPVLTRLGKLSLDVRQQPTLAPALLTSALLAITLRARSFSRSR